MGPGGVNLSKPSKKMANVDSKEYTGYLLSPEVATQLKEASLAAAKSTKHLFPDLKERGISALERLERISIWAIKSTAGDCELAWVKKWQHWWELVVVPFDNDQRTAAEKLVAYVAERKNGFIKETPEIERFENFFGSEYLSCLLS